GRYVVFRSTATDLVSNDYNQAPDLFVRDVLAGDTILVSRRDPNRPSLTPGGSSNVGSFNGSPPSAISADGRFVAFTSSAVNLVPNDTNNASDVFVRDVQAGPTTLVSATPPGASGNGYSDAPVMTADGRYVAFESYASDLVPNDTNNASDVFVRDLQTGTTTLVSTSPFGSFQPVISADGRYVAFQADGELFLRDFQTGTTTLVTESIFGGP